MIAPVDPAAASPDAAPASAPLRRMTVILNAAAGSAARGGSDLAEQVRQAFAGRGIRAEVVQVGGAGIAGAVRAALATGAEAVVAGGGDGTVGAVVQALVLAGAAPGRQAPALGVLPLGTLNHFAKDLGLPLDLEAAVAAIAEGSARRIDLGEVNGHVFINNSSIGVYPMLVEERERHRRRFGWRKGKALAVAVARSARRFPLLRVRLHIAGANLLRTTPFVFIGNNVYGFQPIGFGTRVALDRGRLHCCFPARTGRLTAMGRLAFAALFGQLRANSQLVSLPVRRLVLHSRRRRLAVSLDGEVVRLVPPLRYRSLPGALRVLAPPDAPAPAPAVPVPVATATLPAADGP